MAFSTILVVTLVIYLLYYAGNIVYDLFLSDAAKQSTQSEIEDEIEISDADNQLEGTFYASAIEEEEEEEEETTQEESDGGVSLEEEEHDAQEMTPVMNGGLKIEELVQMVQTAQNDDELQFVTLAYSE